ncbi:hypothetical protein NMG29_36975 [Streptomyces cocklensis]|uniref:Lipoprotein n=1 Tax=Actinacidiphila cocklensis TaxID=887465 RepID=A0A9W4DGU5_9ACTN|nr:hypothetical protein [Actinacidiphila cocklensis]MDD1063692.1 hypothetical protein [Actinacidiphila cocklensis]WSX72889.1 hypothetical protein OH826_02910 [Streptomyces sp. NBC_00899]WSX81043.1 hypothetical protein OH826_48600 [Streptomyces sp. NBC_00899]CAG6391096.1 conserved exported hypothetical protein [Actinacidiphila cocklensis]
MRSTPAAIPVLACLLTGALLAGCGASGSGTADSPAPVATTPATAASASGSTAPPPSPTAAGTHRPQPARTTSAPRTAGPAFAGNPAGHAAVPAAARAADTSKPTRTVGNGTSASCTSAAVVAAVAAGGVITFSCGPRPVVITMKATAKVRNASARVVLDGGGLVTLSGGGRRRILSMDTCDQVQGWTTSHCQDQSTPELTVQNLTFADGNSTGDRAEGGGGGAILVRGGRFKAVNDRFVRNRCDSSGPDLGGAAIRVLDQYHGLPVYVTGSTFGGAPGLGGTCSNGGALSSIGVSWVVLNSVISYNSAVGVGANPARGGTPGGGSGGAVYTDGNRYTVRVEGSLVAHNDAKEGGGAFFFVSNDRTGTLTVRRSTLHANPSHGFSTAGYPGVFYIGAGKPDVSDSTLD